MIGYSIFFRYIIENSNRYVMVSRRQLLSGIATIGSVVSSYPTLQKYNSTEFLEVMLFAEDSVADYSIISDFSAYISSVCRTLPNSIHITVTVSLYSIPKQSKNTTDLSEVYHNWKQFVNTQIPEAERSIFANILFTDNSGSKYIGLAPQISNRSSVLYPCGVVSVNSDMGLYVDTDSIHSENYLTNSHAEPFNTVVHELGHLLGLDHRHGSVVDWDPNTNQVIVTPMIGRYIFQPDFHLKETIFGESIPEIQIPPNKVKIVYTTNYNSQIESTHIAY